MGNRPAEKQSVYSTAPTDWAKVTGTMITYDFIYSKDPISPLLE